MFNTRNEMQSGICFLCRRPASSLCTGCNRNIWFCSQEHQDLHRNAETNECFPFEVAEDDVKGRYLVASRDIEAGELIFRENPLTVGNLHDTEPVCLTCWKPVDGSFTCEDCRLPMCDESCSTNEIHRKSECLIFKSKGVDIRSPENEGDPHPFYQCITPLRCLLMKEQEPQKWAAIQRMMDHVEDKPRDIFWQINQRNIVDYLRKTWNLSERFSESEINHVIGALEVNAFEVTSAQGGRGRGVFPMTALMSHNCISNARYIMHNEVQAEVRSTIRIRSGEEITDHYVTPLNGTVYRRTHLRDSWFFHCNCSRCSDPTEFGTFSSAFLDAKGCGSQGVVLPIDPLNFKSKWKCLSCDNSYDWEGDLSIIEDDLTKILDYCGDEENDIKCDFRRLEQVLVEHKEKLHPSHYLMIAAKRYLVYAYGRNSDLTKMAQKSKLCEEILKVYDVICPGMTKERGLTQFELYSAKKQIFKKDLDNFLKNPSDDVTRQDLLSRGTSSRELLIEIISSLRHERPETFEQIVLSAAQRELVKVKQILEQISVAK